MKARWASHLVGGVAGVLLVLAVALMPVLGDTTRSQTDPWWPLLILAPVVLVLGSFIHNALMARDAVRTGTALADAGPIAGRTAACCALCLALAATRAKLSPTRTGPVNQAPACSTAAVIGMQSRTPGPREQSQVTQAFRWR